MHKLWSSLSALVNLLKRIFTDCFPHISLFHRPSYPPVILDISNFDEFAYAAFVQLSMKTFAHTRHIYDSPYRAT